MGLSDNARQMNRVSRPIHTAVRIEHGLVIPGMGTTQGRGLLCHPRPVLRLEIREIPLPLGCNHPCSPVGLKAVIMEFGNALVIGLARSQQLIVVRQGLDRGASHRCPGSNRRHPHEHAVLFGLGGHGQIRDRHNGVVTPPVVMRIARVNTVHAGSLDQALQFEQDILRPVVLKIQIQGFVGGHTRHGVKIRAMKIVNQVVGQDSMHVDLHGLDIHGLHLQCQLA